MTNKMEEEDKGSDKCFAETETDLSQTHSLLTLRECQSEQSLRKKRIGPYSFYLNDIVGSGFSSTVYKGIKDDDKNSTFAIKVVKLGGIGSSRKNLLEN